jgi:hypothetical protein
VCVARHRMGALATPMPMRAERSSFMVMIVRCWSRFVSSAICEIIFLD